MVVRGEMEDREEREEHEQRNHPGRKTKKKQPFQSSKIPSLMLNLQPSTHNKTSSIRTGSLKATVQEHPATFITHFPTTGTPRNLSGTSWQQLKLSQSVRTQKRQEARSACEMRVCDLHRSCSESMEFVRP